jgi:hypothetical protein
MAGPTDTRPSELRKELLAKKAGEEKQMEKDKDKAKEKR